MMAGFSLERPRVDGSTGIFSNPPLVAAARNMSGRRLRISGSGSRRTTRPGRTVTISGAWSRRWCAAGTCPLPARTSARWSRRFRPRECFGCAGYWSEQSPTRHTRHLWADGSQRGAKLFVGRAGYHACCSPLARVRRLCVFMAGLLIAEDVETQRQESKVFIRGWGGRVLGWMHAPFDFFVTNMYRFGWRCMVVSIELLLVLRVSTSSAIDKPDRTGTGAGSSWLDVKTGGRVP